MRHLSIFVLLVLACCPAAVAGPPNVVVFLADDQGWGDLSSSGNPNIDTPHIDSLARDGARLKNFYVCAVCSPTRAEFLTGRYHTRMGVTSTSQGGERFNADEITIADVFKSAGYRTAAYGKWHSGMQAPYHPNSRGFDDFYGFCSGHWANYFSPMLEHNGRIVQGSGFIVDDLTDHAIDFIKDSGDKPFFVYVPYNTPHSPMQAPLEYWHKFKDRSITSDPAAENAKREDVDFTRAALAMVANIDDNVGRVLDALEAQGISDNTIVCYFSDNGPNSYRYNGGMRGRKGAVHEGGLRSPFLIRYPQRVPAGIEVDEVAGAIDLLPTLTELAGVTTTILSKQLDGRSIVGRLVDNDSTGDESRVLFSAWKSKFSVRSQRFRYHKDGTMFDIEEDRGESINIANRHPAEAERLSALLEGFIAKTVSIGLRGADPRPFPVGDPEMVWTQLPARDAEFTGSIKRNNRWPNCSHLTNWNATSDRVFWNSDVVAPGTFAATVYYACPDGSVGTELTLTAGSAQADAVIDQANDSPVIGREEDLVERGEGYTRRWRKLELGTIQLDQGPTELTLQASRIPGEQAIEFRLLMLERLSTP